MIRTSESGHWLELAVAPSKARFTSINRNQSSPLEGPLRAMRRSQSGERGRHEAAKRRVHLENACYYQYGQDFSDDMPSLAILGR
jgi:hypothetical protein